MTNACHPRNVSLRDLFRKFVHFWQNQSKSLWVRLLRLEGLGFIMQSVEVFEILVKEHTGMLLAFLRASVRDSTAVEDLFQETMLVAWRRLGDFDRDRSFGAWLRGIASKLVLEHYRHVAQRQDHSVDSESLEWFGQQLDRVQSFSGDTWDEKLEALRRCVADLPEHYRETIRLRYEEQLKLGEIISCLDLQMESLKKRLARAKQLLYDCIDRKLLLARAPR
jgi:RNA polymerase sigma-70 factor